ncbi:helix-turn-helix domain-containing protein [Mesorhizobium sp. M8A.F.Ca.ET.207.01.1.1]|uniref:helix-turn-helix domain-containing protein n=1 Tax=Mesorhizobium sp. M8A.F.Ca.ET.207.01.1.1 TaxID=2563968 RepID=UPI00109C5D21|nr:helix-turn-helix domain-containing protein [Mesorhizobium sp. M8A.F.Ca.ET.207.01.1.1]TGQ79330.1 helix-turn-helix domain-containing protein [Mesorhizobium sp. M8A.F.Ca.ET.207.01.1.1]
MMPQRKSRASMSVEDAADQEAFTPERYPLAEEKTSKARNRLDWIDTVALDARVSAHAFRLAHVLQSQFVNEKTGEAWPAQQTLADLCNTNERQVRYWVAELAKAGFLEVKRGGKGRSNRYVLTGSRTAAQRKALTGSGNHLDRQSNYSLTGSRTAADSRLDIAYELGGGAKPSTGSALRSGRRSTVNGVAKGDARPPVSSPANQTRPCWRGMEVNLPKLGDCVVTDTFPDLRRVRVKVIRTGETMLIAAKPDIRFVASPDDFDQIAQEDRDEETPF